MGSIRNLVERLEPGDKVRWYAETDSTQRAPCRAKRIDLNPRTAIVELEGSRGGEYRITVPDQDKPTIAYIQPGGDEDDYGELKWLSVVAGGDFRHNTLYSDDS
jgi:hypothetical protein